MPRRSRRTLPLVAGVSGCNAAAKDDAGSDSSAGSTSFTLVTPDVVGQNEFLKLAVTSIKAAAKAHNGTEKVFESTNTASQQQDVRAAVDAAPDVVVLVGFEFADLVTQHAEAHPKQQFLI
jgi:basic membrane protein A